MRRSASCEKKKSLKTNLNIDIFTWNTVLITAKKVDVELNLFCFSLSTQEAEEKD